MRPIASLSLDLDNLWSYLRTHGDPSWETLPSYLGTVVPRVQEFLNRRQLKLTFFVVGQDLLSDSNRKLVRQMAEDGHEIGNHSYSHQPWMHLDQEEAIEQEIVLAEDLITTTTGVRPTGFRGPGYSISTKTLNILKKRGYLYDASLFPTWIGPLARAYYFGRSHFDKEQAKQRQDLFGNFSNCLNKLGIHRMGRDFQNLYEVPVTTMPLFRTPIHVSYILYLATVSRSIALTYFNLAMQLCRACAVQPSLLLHPLDFISASEAPEVGFFPAMKMSLDEKAELVDEILDRYCSMFTVVTMREHVGHAGGVGPVTGVPSILGCSTQAHGCDFPG